MFRVRLVDLCRYPLWGWRGKWQSLRCCDREVEFGFMQPHGDPYFGFLVGGGALPSFNQRWWPSDLWSLDITEPDFGVPRDKCHKWFLQIMAGMVSGCSLTVKGAFFVFTTNWVPCVHHVRISLERSTGRHVGRITVRSMKPWLHVVGALICVLLRQCRPSTPWRDLDVDIVLFTVSIDCHCVPSESRNVWLVIAINNDITKSVCADHVLWAQKSGWHGVDSGCTAEVEHEFTRFTTCGHGLNSCAACMSPGTPFEEYPNMV